MHNEPWKIVGFERKAFHYSNNKILLYFRPLKRLSYLSLFLHNFINHFHPDTPDVFIFTIILPSYSFHLKLLFASSTTHSHILLKKYTLKIKLPPQALFSHRRILPRRCITF